MIEQTKEQQHQYNLSSTLGVAAVAWAAFLIGAPLDKGSPYILCASWLLAFALPLTTASFLMVRASYYVSTKPASKFFSRVFYPVFLLGVLTTMGAICTLMARHSVPASIVLAGLGVLLVVTVLTGEVIDQMHTLPSKTGA